MSSSANDYSDGGDADELQNDCEAISYTAMMETADAVNSTPTPTVPYTVLPHVGAMTPAAYPYPDPYYRSMFAPYDSQAYAAHPYAAHPMVHLQLMGVQQPGVPLPSDAVEEPVFVNAKQYHGIMRRRQSRAKAELERKALKARKPYLHESRHLHAVRRARGCGGRFVNSKKDVPKELAASDPNLKDEATSKDSSQSVGPHDVNKTGTESN